MKILFVNRYFYPDHSATSQLLSDLAFYLARNGMTVEVITSRQLYDNPMAELNSEEVVNGVRIWRVWSARKGRQRLLARALDYLTFYLTAAWRLFERAGRDDVVVAKTDPPLISTVAALVVKLRRAKLINWVQDLFPEVAIRLGVSQIRAFEGMLMRIRNYSLRAAEANVVLGERMAGMLQQQNIQPERIVVIPNWADGEGIQPIAHNQNRLRKEWGLQDKFIVGYSGNMGRAHEFDTLIDAAVMLRNCTNIMFLFIGDGAQRSSIERRVNDLGLNNIQFREYQPRAMLSNSLSLADVHVISLQREMEGLIVPSKFYGIAAAGRPVLYIGDCDGEIARISLRYDCGVCVEIGDSMAVAQVIRDLSSCEERVEHMGANARKVFEDLFDGKHALNAWHNLLTQIL